MIIPILCPCCGKRLIDTEHTVKSEVIPMNDLLEGESRKADFYAKCRICKNIIGIKKVS